ncbi:MAG: GxxExxY protein [Burkholderiales bacterium]|nr:MAG: GxxExxY protein [Burkholderiales bacterium]TAG84163.1 MAG: GxxExxY protein [Betaproteobacteria bacterium]
MNTDDPAKTEAIIGAAFRVHNALGAGFLESVYARALSVELTKLSIPHRVEYPINVFYDGQSVGEFRADLLVNNEIVIEVKAVTEMVGAHEAQLLNYLRATGLRIGLLINFGSKVTVKRRVV